MQPQPMPAVTRYLRALKPMESDQPLTDSHLLEQFVALGKQADFATLLERHGAMVLGVCRQVLGHHQDAEDAFQVTFLVLARQAASVRKKQALAGWLHGVAFRTAMQAKRSAVRRRKHETRVKAMPTKPFAPDVAWQEIQAVLQEEIERLPPTLRAPFVLCCLENQSLAEAARELHVRPGTVSSRLARARKRLRDRLSRRGVGLTTALGALAISDGAKAAVPASLAEATVHAAIQYAGSKALAKGLIAAQAADLLRAVTRSLLVGKVIVATALLAGLAALAVGGGLMISADKPESLIASSGIGFQGPNEARTRPPAPPAQNDQQGQMTVAGTVLDPQKKPLVNTWVSIVGEAENFGGGHDLSDSKSGLMGHGSKVLGTVRSDSGGAFRLTMTRTSRQQLKHLFVVASSPGYGSGWQELNPDGTAFQAEIQLAPEQILRGRFVDLQGQPAVGVHVKVCQIGVMTPGEFHGMESPADPKELPWWPAPVVTDQQGRFHIRGIGRKTMTRLHVADDRFATRDILVEANAPGETKEVNGVLEPAKIIEGIVRSADTNQPMPLAQLTVYAAKDEFSGFFGVGGQADGKGHFRINPTPGNVFNVNAFPPDGQAYLPLRKSIKWPQPAVLQTMEFALPRGVLVRAHITENGTGKPVPRVAVEFLPHRLNPNLHNDVVTGWEGMVASETNGAVTICVLPGPGHLVLHAPVEYVLQEQSERMIDDARPGGMRFYAHAFVPLNLKSGEPFDLNLTLLRGTTVHGRLLDPNGQPVREALMLSRLGIRQGSLHWRGFPETVRDGAFALSGLERGKTYKVHFIDQKHKLAATAEITGYQAEKIVEVRLAPCGSVKLRAVDAQGKPAAKHSFPLEIVVTPGASRLDRKAYERGELIRDSTFIGNVDRVNHWNPTLTDEEGRVTFGALIPGATYLVMGREFKVEAGKTLDLGDMVVETKE